MNEKPPIRLKFSDSRPMTSPSPKPNAPQAAKPKPHPPVIGTEPVVVKCGHAITFDLYAKDAFREQRRAKAVSRDCPACRQAREQANMLAGKERRAKKASFTKALKPRLPDGARFVATYDANAVQWTGTLTVEGVTFERKGSSLNKLLHKLDDMYRAPPVTVTSTSPDPSATA